MLDIKKLAASLGIAASLSAVFLPVATFADGEVSDSDTLDVQVNVATIISMSIQSHSTELGSRTTNCQSHDPETGEPLDPADQCEDVSSLANQVKTTLLPSSADTTSMYTDIFVSTNSGAGYVLTLADEDTNTSLATASATINTAAGLPVAGTASWAVSIDAGTTWLAMPASDATPITVKNYAASHDLVIEDQSTVRYGVATASDQATGTYTDTITYTATAN